MSFGKDNSPPPAPDPAQLASAQGQANIDAIRESARINAIDEFTPYGSLTYERDSRGVPTSRTVALSPEQQRLLTSQTGLANTLAGLAQNQAGFIPQDRFSLAGLPEFASSIDFSGIPQAPGIDDFSADAARVEQATYDRGLSLLQPELDRQRSSLEQSLADRGLPMTGEAYNTALDRFDTAQGETLSRLAQDAVLAGRGEQSRLFGLGQQARQQAISEQLSDAALGQSARQQGISDALTERGQPFNELSAFLQGSPALQTPNFAPTPQYQVAPPDVLGANQIALNAQQNAYNQQQALNQAGLGGLFGLGSASILGFA